MKLLILFISVTAILAGDVDTSDGSSHYFSQSQSHSVVNSNGNSVVVSHRINSDGKEEQYISVGSPKIRIDGDYFSCATLVCSENAYKCLVTSEALADDRNKLKTVAECFDKDGKSLDKKEFVENNRFPTAEPPYSRVAEVLRDGTIKIEDSNGAETFRSNKKLSKEEQEKLNKEFSETFRIQQENFKKQMDEFDKAMKHTFSTGFFANGGSSGNYNPFRVNVGFGNNFPFGDNFPFGANPYHTFNYNWPFPSYNPFFNNRYDPQIPVDNTFHNSRPSLNVPSYDRQPSLSNNRPQYNPTQESKENEFETELDVSSEVTTNRFTDNDINQNHNRFNDKYRYSHEVDDY